jgi:hypothetical protein
MEILEVPELFGLIDATSKEGKDALLAALD